MSDEIKGKLASRGTNELVDKIRDVLNLGDDETCEIYSPSHKFRHDNIEVKSISKEEFYKLKDLSFYKLGALGLRSWRVNNMTIMLLPYEWYNIIPEGFELIDIFGKIEIFHNGKTDDDCRYGMLAFGIKVN